jgi:tetratricopeptide (TPR) repeat protein
VTPIDRPDAGRGRGLRGAVGFLALLLCAAFSVTQLAEVDLFWHLLAGRRILETGSVPRVDEFTWTSAGRPWIDLHWLFQAGAAEVHRLSGWSGLDALKLALIVGGFALALAAAQLRRSSLAGPLLLLPGIVAAQERFTMRPEAASFFLFGALLLLLEARARRPRLALAAPVLVALWANVHSLYAVGLVTLLLTAIGDLVDGLRDRRRVGAVGPRPIFLAALLAVPASLMTPFGFAGWRLPGTLLFERLASANIYGRSIAEFQAPFSGFGATKAVAAFGLFAALVLIAMIAGRQAAGTADRLVVAAFLTLALLARRNIPLFVLAALPPAAHAASSAWERLAGAARRRGGARARLAAVLPMVAGLTGCVVALVLIPDVVSNRFFARDGTQRYFGLGPAPGFYPDEAAGFVTAAALPGEVLNDMTMGGYLAWRWYPGRRTFIDGRLEVHDPELYAAYLALQQSPGRFEAEARARGIRTVIWSHRHALDAAPLLRHLAGARGWRLVHVDLAAAVFVRDDPDTTVGGGRRTEDPTLPPAIDLDREPLAARLLQEAADAEARTIAADPLPAWARRILPRVEVPAAEVGCGIFFALIDRPALAEPLLRDAVARAPWSAVLHYDLGLVLSQAGRPDEAKTAFEEAWRRDPRLAVAGAALAAMRLRAGDEEGAIAAWRRAERAGSLPASARQARGALLARRGGIDAAIEDYRAALASEPGQAGWRAELALLYVERGLAASARTEIDRAIASDPSACLPHVADARLRRAGGDLAGAVEVAREAVRLLPGCAEARLELARLYSETGRPEEAGREAGEALRLGLDPAVLAADPALRAIAPRP